ncbi:type VII secretion-associated serine protease mycosin [Streptomyces sp. NPDC086989]|uniref:type VII secretion-associated serine protease mycosin n=1 Tax=Streptomyces sp. NPDC086989 TaxID=3365764 RepID=UPI00381F0D9F
MRKATAAVVGLLLAGVAATPAHAETVRSKQWHLDAMKADDVWKISRGKGVTVAVIDTGVARIPELEGQVLPGKNFAAPSYEGDERTDYGHHGTSMAAIIAGNGKGPGGTGSAFGLAPDAKILPLRIDRGGDGGPIFKSMIAAIRYAADSDAKILNISIVGDSASEELTKAVKYALDKGKLIFAGAGNDGDTSNEIYYPAATPGVVGVAAVDAEGAATKESQHNAFVDLSAPGANIVTGCDGGTGLCNSHGTSDATALTSASAALLWSAHPDWTNNQILRVLLNTAGKPDDGARNDYVGYGVVRPRIAVPTPGDPGPADVYPLPDLAAADAKGSPSPSTTGKKPAAGAAQAEAKKDSGSSVLWIGLGLGACVLIGGAVVAVVVRRRSA